MCKIISKEELVVIIVITEVQITSQKVIYANGCICAGIVATWIKPSTVFAVSGEVLCCSCLTYRAISLDIIVCYQIGRVGTRVIWSGCTTKI
jgi:hypothetical protein